MPETHPRSTGPTRRQMLLGGAAAAGTALGSELLDAAPAAAAGTSSTATAQAVVDLTRPTSPFPHVWERVVGGDWAKQALRRDYQDQLFDCHDELGIESLRFHGVLNSSMSTYFPTVNGRPRNPAFSKDDYSFFNVEQVYDALVDRGMRPYVELSSMPASLQGAAPPFSVFLYDFNQMEPKDYALWGKVVGDFARHMVDRYGIREVRTWPFEVWNEPNLFAFFNGDQQAYFKLYQYAAEAIKNVDASLRVGGPATSAGQQSFGPPRSPGVRYYREFMQWATAKGVPVDFGSAHGYETDTGTGPQGPASFFQQNRADTPSGVPLYISETNVAADLGNPALDRSDAAASFLRTIIETVGVVDALAYWSFTDIFEELGQADKPLHGGFGLQSIHGVKKPAYRLLQLLHSVGDRRAPLTLSNAPATVGGIAVTGSARGGGSGGGSGSGGVDVLLYNHALATDDGSAPTPAQPATLTVTLRGVRPGARARVRRIDEDHTNPYQEWIELGSPEYPTRRQLRDIKNASDVVSQPLELKADHGTDVARFTLTLPAEGVAAIHIG
ncbi:GH39 family glycosyl hydrolase [Streptomyces milbemycinicus]|uniref:GH39 family glycosyl hydrolase n=1 Tax=Streptomyces milbemycinicus TaxID=476552 RepID=UPI0033F6D47B